MKKPKLLLVTIDNRTYEVFYSQLKLFFNDLITIIPHTNAENINDIDLILLSANNAMDTQRFPADKTIISRRGINIANLEELVKLPEDTECLVINNFHETAEETIELLKHLGFKFKMYPYHLGIQKVYSGVTTAIVPAALEMVPSYINRVIDIGIRPLDYSTILEISIKLNLNNENANLQSARYIQEIISLSRRLSSSLHEVNKLNHQLEAIFDTVHDGLIASDQNDNIIKINKSSKRILGIRDSNTNIIGQNLYNYFPKQFTTTKEEVDGDEEDVVTVKDKKLVLNKNEIVIKGKKLGHVTAFQDITRIQNLEKTIRKKIQKIGFSSKYTQNDILGHSKKVQDTLRKMKKMAKRDNTVLILGENGSGKELFAHAIHDMSDRRDGPFIPVNFAGLPQSLAESELFGYDEGTFTGGTKGGKQGLFEMAHNGTIFLDEIGDAPIYLQTLLLRVLQEKQVIRVGGRNIIPINVRVIAATNKNLKKMVANGEFREDLYYRLFVLPLRIPPLRERKEDIPYLLNHFINEYSIINPKIDSNVMKKMMNYDWPGNVRELVSVVQYISTVIEGNEVTQSDLPEQFFDEDDNEEIDEDLLTKLKKEGDLYEYYVILASLTKAKNELKSIGRGRVLEYVQSMGCPLTEQKIRKRMSLLRDLGLIYAGTKGQGSRITDAGSSVYIALDAYLK